MATGRRRTSKGPRAARSQAGSRPGDDRERARRLASEGARLLSDRRAAEATVFLARAWELEPRDASIATNLGGAYILQGQHKLAVPILEAASRLEPDNPMVWMNLAAAYLGNLALAGPKEHEQAIAAYQKVLALDPRAPHVHYNLGLIYLDRHDEAQAAQYFMDALVTDPNDHDAQLWLDRISRGHHADVDRDAGGEP